MDKSLSDMKATAKGRNVEDTPNDVLTHNSKSAEDTCTIEPPHIKEDNLGLIKKRIQEIESGLNDIKNKQKKDIIKSFFQRTDTSCSICPDIIYSSSVSSGQDTKLKLKGGGKDNLKVKRFTSDNNNVNLALNALRSSSMLNSYGEHQQCDAKTFCNFCLL